MSNTHWDPVRYGLFGDERRRPAKDLIARLPKPADGFATSHCRSWLRAGIHHRVA